MHDLDELIPPEKLLFDGTVTREEFKHTGTAFVKLFLIERAMLKPHEKVLDVGCGNGQKARPLVNYLNEQGSYDGFDVVQKGIEWCAEKYRKFPNFRFQRADLYSVHYNPKGRYKAAEYRFPYPDGTFDLVLLSSVFTHLLPDAVENYFSEISRVLKPGGRTIITYFLLNSESRRRIDAGLNRVNYQITAKVGVITFPHVYSETCRIADKDVPEAAVAHDEQHIRRLYDRFGFSVSDIAYGYWCGRKELWSLLQDVVIAVKE
jgi:ubiquinone/menaquinone biosynthesis C-methylase UbiE